MKSELGLLAIGITLASLATPVLLNRVILDKTTFGFNASLTAEPAPARQKLNGTRPSIGINADQDLQFGTLFVGASVTKRLNVSTDSATNLRVGSSGNISRILRYEEQRIVNPPVSTVEIEAKPTDPGYYVGTVEITARTSGSKLEEKWLNLRYS